MFLTRSGFKRLITGAFRNGGLYVANTSDGMQIFGAEFNMWIKKGMIPKQSLGDLIALVGELPEPGEAFSAKKEGIQYEMQSVMPQLATELFENCNIYIEPTRALFVSETYIRIFQNDNMGPVAIKEALYSLISASSVDVEHGEKTPEGPKAFISEYGGYGGYDRETGAVWMNDVMAISFRFGDTTQVTREIETLAKTHIARTFEEVR